MDARILLIEDDPSITSLLSETGRGLGASIEHAEDGSSGLEMALSNAYNLVVIDANLPLLDGFEVCRRLREKNSLTAILILTARNDEIDRVRGLELGADDYVTKPFSIREVGARMRVLIHRYEQLRRNNYKPVEKPSLLRFGPLEINLKRREVFIEERKVALTALEFEILSFLAARSGEAISRDELMRGVWGYECSQFESTITTHLSRLRYKFEPQPDKPQFILTVKGVGYRFVSPEEIQ